MEEEKAISIKIEDLNCDVKMEDPLDCSEPAVVEFGAKGEDEGCSGGESEDGGGSEATGVSGIRAWKPRKKACAVAGCLEQGPGVSYFKIPSDFERRKIWLSLMNREDGSCPDSSVVCSRHFSPRDVRAGARRVLLRRTARPRRRLPPPRAPRVRHQAVDAHVPVAHKFVQTAHAAAPRGCQTTVDLLAASPMVKKLKQQLAAARRAAAASARHDKDQFYRLCDKFLNETMVHVVRAQVEARLHCSGNRYSAQYKVFCAELLRASPRAYAVLGAALVLPRAGTLRAGGDSRATSAVAEPASLTLDASHAEGLPVMRDTYDTDPPAPDPYLDYT